MSHDDIAIRPVITGNAVRPVHRDSPSRDSTGGQRAHSHEFAEAEEASTAEAGALVLEEESHLIDLQA
ncbi:MAG: hypothetical protein NZ749_06445 [bacterium]|nr:hypothetical protein [bacterium]